MIEFLEYSNKVKELYIGKDTINKVIEAYKKSIIENDKFPSDEDNDDIVLSLTLTSS